MNKKEAASEKIEILSLGLFGTHREEMRVVELFQKHFDSSMGWHYYLDLIWIIREIKKLPRGALVLDAGAGGGLLQFILAELGYNVISADFSSRNFSEECKKRYGMHYLNSQEKVFENRYTRHLNAIGKRKGPLTSFLEALFRWKGKIPDPVEVINKHKVLPQGEPLPLLETQSGKSCGRIFLCKCDLKEMPFLPGDFVDAIVSVSALEHNEYTDFEKCIDELLRVTKPLGKLIITVSASQSEDWFHEPSQGWCYSERTIKRLFRLTEEVGSNFQRKEEFFEELIEEGNELHKRIAPVYFKSGNNGMPWGKWDPKYQPVGIIKVK